MRAWFIWERFMEEAGLQQSLQEGGVSSRWGLAAEGKSQGESNTLAMCSRRKYFLCLSPYMKRTVCGSGSFKKITR